MKRFIQKIVLGLILLGIVLALITVFDMKAVGCQYEDGYEASILDKLARLESLDEPKIILVGNSNLAFGIDSTMIEEELGMPVVNLGLQGGLGNRFHEQMLQGHVQSGDIVIVCHTEYDDDGKILNGDTAWKTLEWHSELWKLIAKKDIPKLLLNFPSYVLGSVLKWITGTSMEAYDSVYKREAFNENGDVAIRTETERYRFGEEVQLPPSLSETCADRLNELNAYVEAQGATMYVAAYPVGYESVLPDRAIFDNFEHSLRTALDCDVISHWTDYFMPQEYFYDTAYHLTLEGAKYRTALLIEDIRNAEN